jgi:hypothetical protein
MLGFILVWVDGNPIISIYRVLWTQRSELSAPYMPEATRSFNAFLMS